MVGRVTWDGAIVTMYHYVMTADYPYSIGCFKGTLTETGQSPSPNERAAYPPIVSLRDRARKRFSASVADLDKARLQDRYAGLDITNICDVTLREPARFGGEVQGLRVVPRSGSSSLEITVSDGSGRAVAVFLGRHSLPGLEPGRGVVLEGVPRKEGNRTVLLNPAYTLLPH